MRNLLDAVVEISDDSYEATMERLDDLYLAEIAKTRSSDESVPVDLDDL